MVLFLGFHSSVSGLYQRSFSFVLCVEKARLAYEDFRNVILKT